MLSNSSDSVMELSSDTPPASASAASEGSWSNDSMHDDSDAVSGEDSASGSASESAAHDATLDDSTTSDAARCETYPAESIGALLPLIEWFEARAPQTCDAWLEKMTSLRRVLQQIQQTPASLEDLPESSRKPSVSPCRDPLSTAPVRRFCWPTQSSLQKQIATEQPLTAVISAATSHTRVLRQELEQLERALEAKSEKTVPAVDVVHTSIFNNLRDHTEKVSTELATLRAETAVHRSALEREGVPSITALLQELQQKRCEVARLRERNAGLTSDLSEARRRHAVDVCAKAVAGSQALVRDRNPALDTACVKIDQLLAATAAIGVRVAQTTDQRDSLCLSSAACMRLFSELFSEGEQREAVSAFLDAATALRASAAAIALQAEESVKVVAAADAVLRSSAQWQPAPAAVLPTTTKGEMTLPEGTNMAPTPRRGTAAAFLSMQGENEHLKKELRTVRANLQVANDEIMELQEAVRNACGLTPAQLAEERAATFAATQTLAADLCSQQKTFEAVLGRMLSEAIGWDVTWAGNDPQSIVLSVNGGDHFPALALRLADDTLTLVTDAPLPRGVTSGADVSGFLASQTVSRFQRQRLAAIDAAESAARLQIMSARRAELLDTLTDIAVVSREALVRAVIGRSELAQRSGLLRQAEASRTHAEHLESERQWQTAPPPQVPQSPPPVMGEEAASETLPGVKRGRSSSPQTIGDTHLPTRDKDDTAGPPAKALRADVQSPASVTQARSRSGSPATAAAEVQDTDDVAQGESGDDFEPVLLRRSGQVPMAALASNLDDAAPAVTSHRRVVHTDNGDDNADEDDNAGTTETIIRMGTLRGSASTNNPLDAQADSLVAPDEESAKEPPKAHAASEDSASEDGVESGGDDGDDGGLGDNPWDD